MSVPRLRRLNRPTLDNLSAGSINHGVQHFAEIMVGMVEHYRYHQRQQGAKDGDGVLQLFAVDAAVPGGAAVHELVAHDVEPVEHDAEPGDATTI